LDLISEQFIQNYSSYITSFESSQSTLRTFLEQKPLFLKFIRQTEKKQECNLHTIQDFLISVVQRIPHYITLLHDLQSNTEVIKEKDQIILAHRKLKEIADSINQRKKDIENIKKLRKIYLECGVKDIPDGKVFLYEETVYSSKNDREKRRKKVF